ncbi:unnamed protein product [Fraxinus pennsylvanica]|uniref:V-type proton ATPase proteolipid subunit n=1 Tax=Fraxinus pennsylvanica TaxID=56036 RepID=A0AAD2A2Q0_9LAMI|nr:unnamed protein product [Fraxinus pennsylvanica]
MSSTFSGDETAPFFGFLGAAAALVFSCMGAAYGTAKSGVGVASMGVMRPELVMKSIVPVVMAGVLGIYGLIIAVIISTGINPKAKSYYLFDGYAHLSSGLACGLAGLSAGMAIGIVGDAGVRANAQQPKLFVGMILILIFAEALALYGLIVGIILSSRAGPFGPDLVRRYTSARFGERSQGDVLTEEESRLLTDYTYHTLAAKSSGDLCLKYIFSFGAFARMPLLHRASEWKVPTTFVYGFQDWMTYLGAQEARKQMKVPCEIIRVPRGGHFVFIDNPAAFHSAVFYACRNFISPDQDNISLPEGLESV